jgi:hypothetical protein
MTSGQGFKFLCVLLYAAIVGGCFWYVHSRITPHSMAAHQIAKDQLIGGADIVSIDQKDIIRHRSLRAFAAGETIAATDVTPAPDLLAESTVATGKSEAPAKLLPARNGRSRKR